MAPQNNQLTAAGTGPIKPNVTQANGCAVVAGCKSVTVTTVSGDNRYNLVGNPFPYAVDWTQVRIRIDGSSSTYTPCQAALVAEPACTGSKPAQAVVSNVVNIWNGSTYQSFSDIAPYPILPNLQYFKSFWVNVLPGAHGHTIEVLIPAAVSTQAQADLPAPTRLASGRLPWYLGWLDWLVAPAAAQPPAPPAVSGHAHPQALSNARDWYVRLKLENRVTGWNDHGNLLGQLSDAQAGLDPHDVPEMPPFAKPYLTLVFPHPEWGSKAGDYTSDFHPPNNGPDEWTFEVRGDPVGGVVFLSWEGDEQVLKRSRLTDVQTGKTIEPGAANWARKGYPLTLNSTVQRYVWRYRGK